MWRWVAVVALVAVVGCATQRYGRLTAVSPGERSSLTCEQIALEIEKAEFFVTDVRRQRADTNFNHFLGFMGDFGVGNVIEGDAAEVSGLERHAQLQAMQSDRGCLRRTGR